MRHPYIVIRLLAARAALLAACGLALAGQAVGVARAAPVLRSSPWAIVRFGSAPAIPRNAVPEAGIASATPMEVTVVLKPRDPAALEAYALGASTPGSPFFHRYLTPAEFALRFGPSPSAAAAVLSSLRSHGLEPERRSANGLSFTVRADAGMIERAFALSLVRFALPKGRVAVINTLAPAVDARIVDSLQAVVGLSSLQAMHALALRHTGTGHVAAPGAATARSAARTATAHTATADAGPEPCAAARTAAAQQSAYTTDQIASAYDFSPLYANGDDGQGETVAIYELEPDDPADIQAYQTCYGTSAKVSDVPVDGGSGSGPGSGEAALDIEQVIAFAPQATVLVYQGPNSASNDPGSGPYDVFSKIVSQDRAQVVTNSWGNCEPDEGVADARAESVLFEEAATQGQTIVSAAGDDGSEDCDGYDQGPGADSQLSLAVDDPASQPFVTGVGGTSLQLAPSQTESVWNNTSGGGGGGIQPGAGGGGISQFWSMPAYQYGAPSTLNVIEPGLTSGSVCGAGSGYCREVPDVSADADPDTAYLIYYNGAGSVPGTPAGWQGTGGTSGSTPLWAALFALVDADPGCNGSPLGFANPELYRAAALAGGEGTYFDDITSGDNDFTGTGDGRYPAGPGYDMASGLGSPKAAALAGYVCQAGLTLDDPGAQRVLLGDPVSLQLDAGGGAALRFDASGLPPGLGIDQHNGRITGKPSRAGVYTVMIGVSDAGGAQQEISVSWTVVGRPVILAARLTSVASGRPKLSLSLAAGAQEPGIAAVSIEPPSGLFFASRRNAWRSASGAGALRYTFAVVAGGALDLRLRSASPRLAVNIAYDLLRARASLERAVSHHDRAKLRFVMTVTDAAGNATALTLTLSPGS